MLDTVVIGWNGTAQARDALALARCLLRPGGSLIAVHSYSAGGGGEIAGFAGWHQLVGQDAARVAEAVRSEPDGADAMPLTVEAASPAAALSEIAEEHCADAIVVGSTSRGTFGRILTGDVGDRLLHGAPCPVAVAPCGFADHAAAPPARIGVGFDGHDESRRALAVAQQLASERGARLDALAVVDPAALPRGRASIAFPGYEDAVRAAVETELQAAVDGLPEAVDASGTVLAGDPASELAAFAGRGLDLLVVGSRGYGPLRRVLLGGVSSKLMRLSPVPVMVVPRTCEVPAAVAA